jgi:hypothetical protein
VVNTILVSPDFHLRMVRSSTSSRFASWMSVRGSATERAGHQRFLAWSTPLRAAGYGH